MNYNDYINASFQDQMKMMLESIKNEQERLKSEDYLMASPIDKIKIQINHLKEEQVRIDSGYYLTAPWTERVVYIAREIKERIEKETNLKISEIESHLDVLINNKQYVVALLGIIDKSLPNVGNLEKVNTLLDRLIFLLNEMKEKQGHLDELKK